MISTHFSGHPLCPVFLFIVIPQGLLGLEPTRAHFTMEDVLLLVGALQVGLKGSGKLIIRVGLISQERLLALTFREGFPMNRWSQYSQI